MKDDPDVNYLPGILLAVLLAGGIVVIVILKKGSLKKTKIYK